MAVVDEIIKVLTEFGKKTVPDLQSSLKTKLAAKAAKYGTRRNSSSRLANSIKFSFPAKVGTISFALSMDEYGEAVDGGRKAHGVDAAGQKSIKAWSERNGIAEKLRKKDLEERLAAQGKSKRKKKKPLKKMPFERASKSIAFLVSRKLKEKGFEGNHFFSEVIKDGRIEELKARLTEIIKSEIRIEIQTKIK